MRVDYLLPFALDWVNQFGERTTDTAAVFRYGCRVRRAVPDIGDIAGNSAQASRQSARSSFITLTVRLVLPAPAWLRLPRSYSTPQGGPVTIRSGFIGPCSRSKSVATVLPSDIRCARHQ